LVSNYQVFYKQYRQQKNLKYIMATKKQPHQPAEIPSTENVPEIVRPVDPEEPIIPVEDPDIIPDEDPFENPPPYEIPEPGEGP
jgi:hypothetical protein